MTSQARLLHHMDVLKHCVRYDWSNLQSKALSAADIADLGSQIGCCQDALMDLWNRLSEIEAGQRTIPSPAE